jgi:hypothetical protein
MIDERGYGHGSVSNYCLYQQRHQWPLVPCPWNEVTGTDFMVLRTNGNTWSLEYLGENRMKKYGSRYCLNRMKKYN